MDVKVNNYRWQIRSAIVEVAPRDAYTIKPIAPWLHIYLLTRGDGLRIVSMYPGRSSGRTLKVTGCLDITYQALGRQVVVPPELRVKCIRIKQASREVIREIRGKVQKQLTIRSSDKKLSLPHCTKYMSVTWASSSYSSTSEQCFFISSFNHIDVKE